MYDVLNFIDNEEIREYNRNTLFTPMEQAILIRHSLRTSVEQKLSAWKMLLEQYSEKDFQDSYVGHMADTDVNFMTVVQKEIERYERAFSYQYAVENAVFGARLYEEDFPEQSVENRFFSTYEKAFNYLKREKQSYLNDEDLKDVRTKGAIDIKWLDQDEACDSVTFYFDNQLTITKVEADFNDDNEWPDMTMYSAYVPLPFKKGDILKSIEKQCDGESTYGVLAHEVNDERMIRFLRNYGDSSDMSVTLDTVWKENGRHLIGHEHLMFLHIERCSEEELPEDMQLLKIVSSLRKRNMDVNNVLMGDYLIEQE